MSRGSVIVNLRRMNRVLEINEELGYAVVEPGVPGSTSTTRSSGRSQAAPSIADLGWGSVVGNTLDHGVTYLPYGQDMAVQCGMEVVLPGGELMRTGNGLCPGQQGVACLQARPGPTPDQLFMQSNFGIVTKMGVWLMPTPGVLHAVLASGLEGHRPPAGRRDAAGADARQEHRSVPRSQHAPPWHRCSRVATSGTTATDPMPDA